MKITNKPIIGRGDEDSNLSIVTYTGKRMNLRKPDPKDVCIEDIAHHLAMECRFGGACKNRYSVAEHSIEVSYLLEGTPGLPVEAPLIGLLHDSPEAYMKDFPSPWKLIFPEYKIVEHQFYETILKGLGLPFPAMLPSYIKEADDTMYQIEQYELMPIRSDDNRLSDREYGSLKRGYELMCMDEREAEMDFLMRYEELRDNLNV